MPTYDGVSLSHQKEGNPAVWDSSHPPAGHHAQRKKLDREKQLRYAIPSMWGLEKEKEELMETQSGMAGAGHGV